MITYETKWKEITYDRYKSLTNGMSDLEISFFINVTKRVKRDVEFSGVPKGAGILNSIDIIQENVKNAVEPDDYEYFENVGTQTVIYGGRETIDRFEKIMNE